MSPPPSPAARIGLAALNIGGAALCAFAASTIDTASYDPSFGLSAEAWAPLRYVFAGLAGACLALGLPLSLLTSPGPRSFARALATVGITAGGVATLVRLLAGAQL